MSRTPTNNKSHPHLNGLSHVAESLVQIVQFLVSCSEKKDSSKMEHPHFERDLGPPVTISHSLLDNNGMKAMYEQFIDYVALSKFLFALGRTIWTSLMPHVIF